MTRTTNLDVEAGGASLLAATSPLVKLGLALAWLVGLATTTRVEPPLLLAGVAIAAAIVAGGIEPRRLVRRLAPLLLVALAVALANLIFAGSNSDPTAAELVRLGPLRLSVEAARGAAGLAARVLAIVSVGAVFTLTTEPTRLVDALVQQAHVSERFAYGALAAYQAVPRLANDLTTLRGARRLRGLRWGWHPRLFVGLLVRAIRHADQLALAMDARAFGTGPRSTFRPQPWRPLDAVVGVAGLAALVVAFAAGVTAT
ncbi:MAG TPA: energy-coupling factor transporter transmembrane component T [Candidatus Eisenbacteria bacterium]|nr:energy-coupling factor transporter transmembrane component T [Candidatus Eisenbacteria bacterium]